MNAEPESGYGTQTETEQISKQVGAAMFGRGRYIPLWIRDFADLFCPFGRTLCSRRYSESYYGELDEEHGVLGDSRKGNKEDKPDQLIEFSPILLPYRKAIQRAKW